MKKVGVVSIFVLLLSSVGIAQETESPKTSSPVAPATPSAAVLSADLVIAKDVVDREPVGEADSFLVTDEKIVGWTRIKGAMNPTKVSHVWSYNGEQADVVELPVTSASYRTWSRKTITDMKGQWTLDVKDNAGNVIASKTVTVKEAAPKEPAAPEQPATP